MFPQQRNKFLASAFALLSQSLISVSLFCWTSRWKHFISLFSLNPQIKIQRNKFWQTCRQWTVWNIAEIYLYGFFLDLDWVCKNMFESSCMYFVSIILLHKIPNVVTHQRNTRSPYKKWIKPPELGFKPLFKKELLSSEIF